MKLLVCRRMLRGRRWQPDGRCVFFQARHASGSRPPEISRLRRRKDPIGRIAPDAVAMSKALQGQGARTAAIANGGIVD
jgi:hypothetical protein